MVTCIIIHWVMKANSGINSLREFTILMSLFLIKQFSLLLQYIFSFDFLLSYLHVYMLFDCGSLSLFICLHAGCRRGDDVGSSGSYTISRRGDSPQDAAGPGAQ